MHINLTAVHHLAARTPPSHLLHGPSIPAVSFALLPLLQDTIVFGADNLDSAAARQAELASGTLPLGIGANTTIRKAIIDSNARIGSWCSLTNKAGVVDGANKGLPEGVVIKDGILVVMRGAVVPNNTTV